MTFFFDENISPKVVQALRILGADVRHMVEVPELGPGTVDTVWIPYVGKCEWTVLTGDLRIRSRPHEKAALAASGLICIFYQQRHFNHLDPFEQAAWWLRRWAVIETTARKAKPGEQFMLHAKSHTKVDRL